MHTMSEGTQEAAGSRELACVLCGRVHADLGIIGNKYVMKGIYFHTFCVTFSSGLLQRGSDGSSHFCTQDLIRTVRQAEQTVSTGPEQGALCQERHGKLSLVQRKQSQPFQPAPGESPAPVDEPCSPGSSAECHPALPSPCALPRGAGPAA
ncbi:uncharacterized protein LOC121106629 isoform X1 [Gallus gallus]|uniref:uncharacterized protein LOC121106629 isoform X1 n=1 Tax=Gallus gallus TaxID=9031 RepID=UPI001AE9C1C3|nr:uncharacterized protein LOC121106629 isoform X1 [Gallus gallus]